MNDFLIWTRKNKDNSLYIIDCDSELGTQPFRTRATGRVTLLSAAGLLRYWEERGDRGGVMVARNVTLQTFTEDNRDLCLCVCVWCCVQFLASDSLEAVDIIIVVKRGMVTASVTRMRHVLIRLTLTFIQGHTDRNHQNNECFDYSRNYSKAMPITFAVRIVRLNCYIFCYNYCLPVR